MAETFKDKFGIEWNVQRPAKPGGMFQGTLVIPAYGSQPGQTLIVAPDLARLIGEANAFADDFIKSGGKPPARGTLDVTAKRDSGAVFLVLLAAFLLLKGNRR